MRDRGGGTLGIDVGGSKLLCCVLDAAGEVRAERRLATGRATGPREILSAVGALAGELCGVEGIGIGFPGLVDHERGAVRSSIMLDGWRDVPLAALVEDAIGLSCAVDNDVNAAARR